MMHINNFPAPASYSQVRSSGLLFLATTPNPSTKQWNEHAYWQVLLPDLRQLYNGICNYCATWIPHSTGQHSVDHFLDKNMHPELAYQWENYRYVSARFNARKGTKSIVDPVFLPANTFVININNFFIEVNPASNRSILQNHALETIKILKLNHRDLVEERIEFYMRYCAGDISRVYFQQKSPFLASELIRQGLI